MSIPKGKTHLDTLLEGLGKVKAEKPKGKVGETAYDFANDVLDREEERTTYFDPIEGKAIDTGTDTSSPIYIQNDPDLTMDPNMVIDYDSDAGEVGTGGWYSQTMNAIDEIDIKKWEGKIVDYNKQKFALQDEAKSLITQGETTGETDEERLKEIEIELVELDEDIAEAHEWIEHNVEDITTSPVDKLYQIETQAALAEERTELMKYFTAELPDDLGGGLMDAGIQYGVPLAAMGGKQFFKYMVKRTASGGNPWVVGSMLTYDVAATVGVLGGLYKQRENEMYAEVGDAYEARKGKLTDEWIQANLTYDKEGVPQVKDPTPEDVEQIEREAMEGLENFKQLQMNLFVGDAVQTLLIVAPWTKMWKNAVGFNWGTRAGIGTAAYGSAAYGEGREEGDQWQITQDFIHGKLRNVDPTWTNLGYDATSIEESFSYAFNSLDAMGTMYGITPWSPEFDPELDDPEFRNAVRAGSILGLLMGSPGHVASLYGQKADFYKARKDVKDFAELMLAKEKAGSRVDLYKKMYGEGKADYILEAMRNIKKSKRLPDGMDKETINAEITLAEEAKDTWQKIMVDQGTRPTITGIKKEIFPESERFLAFAGAINAIASKNLIKETGEALTKRIDGLYNTTMIKDNDQSWKDISKLENKLGALEQIDELIDNTKGTLHEYQLEYKKAVLKELRDTQIELGKYQGPIDGTTKYMDHKAEDIPAPAIDEEVKKAEWRKFHNKFMEQQLDRVYNILIKPKKTKADIQKAQNVIDFLKNAHGSEIANTIKEAVKGFAGQTLEEQKTTIANLKKQHEETATPEVTEALEEGTAVVNKEEAKQAAQEQPSKSRIEGIEREVEGAFQRIQNQDPRDIEEVVEAYSALKNEQQNEERFEDPSYVERLLSLQKEIALLEGTESPTEVVKENTSLENTTATTKTADPPTETPSNTSYNIEVAEQEKEVKLVSQTAEYMEGWIKVEGMETAQRIPLLDKNGNIVELGNLKTKDKKRTPEGYKGVIQYAEGEKQKKGVPTGAQGIPLYYRLPMRDSENNLLTADDGSGELVYSKVGELVPYNFAVKTTYEGEVKEITRGKQQYYYVFDKNIPASERFNLKDLNSADLSVGDQVELRILSKEEEEYFVRHDNASEVAKSFIPMYIFKLGDYAAGKKPLTLLPGGEVNEVVNKLRFDMLNKGLDAIIATIEEKTNGWVINTKIDNVSVKNPLSFAIEEDTPLGYGTNNQVEFPNTDVEVSTMYSLKLDDGAVYAAVNSANSLVPVRLENNNLSKEAAEKVIAILESEETVEDKREKVSQIVPLYKSASEKGEQDRLYMDNIHLGIPFEGQTVYVQVGKEGRQKAINLIKALKGQAFKYRIAKEGEIDNTLIDAKAGKKFRTALLEYLQTRRYRVNKDDLNRTTPFTSPVTNKEHTSYFAYLNTERILTTDMASKEEQQFRGTVLSLRSNSKEQQGVSEQATVTETVKENVNQTLTLFPLEEKTDDTQKTQKTTKTKPKKPKDLGGLLDKKLLKKYKLKDLKESPLTADEILWFKSTYGEESLRVLPHIKSIFIQGEEAWGFYWNGIATVAELGQAGALYHEAWHKVFNMHLTEEERFQIEMEAQALYGINDINNDIEEALGGLTPAGPGFAEYMQGFEGFTGKIKKFFQEIAFQIRRLLGKTTAIERAFRKARRGSDAVVNTRGEALRGEIMAEKRIMPSHLKLLMIEGFTDEEVREAVSVINYDLFSSLMKHEDSMEAVDKKMQDPETIKKTYEKVREAYRELADDLESDPDYLEVAANYKNVIHEDNWEDTKDALGNRRKGFLTLATEALKIQGYNVLTEENITEDLHEINFFLRDTKDTLSRDIKRFLSMIPNEEVGEFLHRSSFVPFDELYGYLTFQLADETNIEKRLQYLAQIKTDLGDNAIKEIYERFANAEPWFKNKFKTHFRKQQIRFITVLLKENGTIQLIETNRRGLKRAIHNEWNENRNLKDLFALEADKMINEDVLEKMKTAFDELRTMRKEYKESIITEEYINKASEVFEYVGIQLDKISKDAIKRNIDLNTFNDMLFGSRNSFGYVIQGLEKQKDPYEGPEKAIDRLADMIIETRTDLYTGSFVNGEKKMVFSINLHDFMSLEFDKFRDKESLKHEMSRFHTDPLYRPIQDTEDPLFGKYDDMFLNMLWTDDEARENFTIHTLDVLKTSEGKIGKGYKDMDPKMTAKTRLSLYFNNNHKFTYINTGTKGDKGRAIYMKIPRIIRHSPWWSSSESSTTLKGIKDSALENLKTLTFQESARILRTEMELFGDETTAPLRDNELVKNKHYNPKLDKNKDGSFKAGFRKNRNGNGFKFLQVPTLNDPALGLFTKEGKLIMPGDGVYSLDDFTAKQKLKSEMIGAYLNERILAGKKALEDQGLIKDIGEGNFVNVDLPGDFIKGKTKRIGKEDEVSRALDEFLINDLILRKNVQKFLYFDLALYKNTSNTWYPDITIDASKRGYQTITPGPVPNTVDVHGEGYGKPKHIRAGIFYDIWKQNAIPYLSDLAEYLSPSLKGRATALLTELESKSMDVVADEKGLTIDEKETLRIISNYTNSNKTDGWGMTTLESHIGSLRSQGLWLNWMQEAYENYWSKGLPSPAGVETYPFHPLKTFMFGKRVVKTSQEFSFILPEQVKHSTMPLLPEMTKNYPQLDMLRKRMELVDEFAPGGEYNLDGALQPLDVVNFDSAIKVGSYGEVDYTNLQNIVVRNLLAANERAPQAEPVEEGKTREVSQAAKNILANVSNTNEYKVEVGELRKLEVTDVTEREPKKRGKIFPIVTSRGVVLDGNNRLRQDPNVPSININSWKQLEKNIKRIRGAAKYNKNISLLVDFYKENTDNKFKKTFESEETRDLSEQGNWGTYDIVPVTLTGDAAINEQKDRRESKLNTLLTEILKGKPDTGTYITEERKDTFSGLELKNLYNDLYAEKIKRTRESLDQEIGTVELKDALQKFDLMDKAYVKAEQDQTQESMQAAIDAKAAFGEAQLGYLTKIRDLIQKEATSRDMIDNVSLSVEIEKVNTLLKVYDFKLPLSFPAYSRGHEGTLLSLFNNSILKQNINGGHAIQLADYGHELAPVGELQYYKVSETDDTIIYEAESDVPHELAEKLGFFKDPNVEISDKARRFIVYRIPNQGKSSMVLFRVRNVLPKGVGRAIRIPGELTTQMGIDFDFDKMYYQVPYNVIRKEEDPDMGWLLGGKSILVPRRLDFAKDIAKMSDADIESAIFEIRWGILKNRTHFKEMMNPLDSTTYENKLEEYTKLGIGIAPPSRDVASYENDVYFEALHKDAKALVAIFSTHASSHAISQSAGTRLVEDYSIKIQTEEGGDIVYESRDLSKINAYDGNLISTYLQEDQNAALDNATNPVTGPLNVTIFTSGVKELIIRAGYSNDLSIDFINQPIIRALSKAFSLAELPKNLDVIAEEVAKAAGILRYFTKEKTTSEAPISKESLKAGLVVDITPVEVKDFPNNAVYGKKTLWQQAPGFPNAEVKAAGVTNTHDAIEQGFRTGSSRNDLKGMKVGDVVNVGRKNTPLYAEVTKVHNVTLQDLLDKGKITLEEWSKIEGWAPDYAKTNPAVLQKYPFEFKLLDDPTTIPPREITDQQKAIQGYVLREFVEHYSTAIDLARVNKLLSPDTTVDMGSLSGIEVFLRVLDYIKGDKSRISLPFVYTADEKLSKAKRMDAYVKEGVLHAQNFVGEFIPYNREAFLILKRNIALATGQKDGLLTKELTDLINMASYSYIFTAEGSPMNPVFENKRELKNQLFDAKKGIAAEYTRIKGKYNLSKNALFKYIKTADTNFKKGHWLYELHFNSAAKIAPAVKNQIKDQWEAWLLRPAELIEKYNPEYSIEEIEVAAEEVRQFANNLAIYAVTTTAFQGGPNSFTSLIPPHYWAANGFSDFYRQQEGRFLLDPNYFMLGARQFIQNLVAAPGLVKSITADDVMIQAEGKAYKGAIREDKSIAWFKIHKNSFQSAFDRKTGEAAGYLKMYDKGIGRFRLYESIKQMGDLAIYKEIPVFGELNKLVEMDAQIAEPSRSIHPNNTYIVPVLPEEYKIYEKIPQQPVITKEAINEEEKKDTTPIDPNQGKLFHKPEDLFNMMEPASKEYIIKQAKRIMGEKNTKISWRNIITQDPKAIGRYFNGMAEYVLGRSTKETAHHEPIHFFLNRLINKDDYAFLRQEFSQSIERRVVDQGEMEVEIQERIVDAAVEFDIGRQNFTGRVAAILNNFWRRVKEFFNVPLQGKDRIADIFYSIGVKTEAAQEDNILRYLNQEKNKNLPAVISTEKLLDIPMPSTAEEVNDLGNTTLDTDPTDITTVIHLGPSAIEAADEGRKEYASTLSSMIFEGGVDDQGFPLELTEEEFVAVKLELDIADMRDTYAQIKEFTAFETLHKSKIDKLKEMFPPAKRAFAPRSMKHVFALVNVLSQQGKKKFFEWFVAHYSEYIKEDALSGKIGSPYAPYGHNSIQVNPMSIERDAFEHLSNPRFKAPDVVAALQKMVIISATEGTVIDFSIPTFDLDAKKEEYRQKLEEDNAKLQKAGETYEFVEEDLEAIYDEDTKFLSDVLTTIDLHIKSAEIFKSRGEQRINIEQDHAFNKALKKLRQGITAAEQANWNAYRNELLEQGITDLTFEQFGEGLKDFVHKKLGIKATTAPGGSINHGSDNQNHASVNYGLNNIFKNEFTSKMFGSKEAAKTLLKTLSTPDESTLTVGQAKAIEQGFATVGYEIFDGENWTQVQVKEEDLIGNGSLRIIYNHGPIDADNMPSDQKGLLHGFKQISKGKTALTGYGLDENYNPSYNPIATGQRKTLMHYPTGYYHRFDMEVPNQEGFPPEYRGKRLRFTWSYQSDIIPEFNKAIQREKQNLSKEDQKTLEETGELKTSTTNKARTRVKNEAEVALGEKRLRETRMVGLYNLVKRQTSMKANADGLLEGLRKLMKVATEAIAKKKIKEDHLPFTNTEDYLKAEQNLALQNKIVSQDTHEKLRSLAYQFEGLNRRMKYMDSKAVNKPIGELTALELAQFVFDYHSLLGEFSVISTSKNSSEFKSKLDILINEAGKKRIGRDEHKFRKAAMALKRGWLNFGENNLGILYRNPKTGYYHLSTVIDYFSNTRLASSNMRQTSDLTGFYAKRSDGKDISISDPHVAGRSAIGLHPQNPEMLKALRGTELDVSMAKRTIEGEKSIPVSIPDILHKMAQKALKLSEELMKMSDKDFERETKRRGWYMSTVNPDGTRNIKNIFSLVKEALHSKEGMLEEVLEEVYADYLKQQNINPEMYWRDSRALELHPQHNYYLQSTTKEYREKKVPYVKDPHVGTTIAHILADRNQPREKEKWELEGSHGQERAQAVLFLKAIEKGRLLTPSEIEKAVQKEVSDLKQQDLVGGEDMRHRFYNDMKGISMQLDVALNKLTGGHNFFKKLSFDQSGMGTKKWKQVINTLRTRKTSPVGSRSLKHFLTLREMTANKFWEVYTSEINPQKKYRYKQNFFTEVMEDPTLMLQFYQSLYSRINEIKRFPPISQTM